MIYVVLLLLFSLAINGVFVWYTRKLLQDLFFVSSNIEGLYEQVDGFSSHLQEVHKRETYYGDPTLEGLIQHSKELVEEMQEYRNVCSNFGSGSATYWHIKTNFKSYDGRIE